MSITLKGSRLQDEGEATLSLVLPSRGCGPRPNEPTRAKRGALQLRMFNYVREEEVGNVGVPDQGRRRVENRVRWVNHLRQLLGRNFSGGTTENCATQPSTGL